MIPEIPKSFENEGGTTFDRSAPEPIDLQHKDSSFFSYFKAPITNKYPCRDVQLRDLYELIKGDTFKSQTLKLRSLTDQEAAKIFKTSHFDYVTISGTFTERTDSKLVKRSNFICIDIDHVGNSDALFKVAFKIIENFKPALMFTSPSGDGLKVMFKVDIEAADHNPFFKALQRYFSEVIGQNIDPSGKDISRACFLPSDPDVYYNPDCDVLDKEFINTYHPIEVQPMRHNIPDEDYVKLSEPDEIMERLIIWAGKEESFINGNRNNFICKLANAFNRYGISENDAINRLVEYAEPGFTESEIKKIIRSVYKHTERHGVASFEQNKPNNELKNVVKDQQNAKIPANAPLPLFTPPFPIEGFPFDIQSIINECARVYGTHRDYWANAFLQATAIAMGATYQIKDKYNNGAVLWTALVGSTGIGKTEPLDFALKHIYEADFTEWELYSQKMENHKAITALTPQERSKQGIVIPKLPIQKQYLTMDSTPEALLELLHKNPRGIAIIRDELLGWVNEFERYSPSGAVQNMLSSWNEKTFKVNRKGRDAEMIKKPFIPVFGSIQPAKLPLLAKDGRAVDGFMQRFIFAYPDEVKKPDYVDEILKDDYQNHYKKYISSLLSLTGDRKSIFLSEEAKKLYKSFFNFNTALINKESCDYVRGMYSKLEIIVLRLALILHISHHVIDNEFDLPIQPEIMKAAIDMTEYFRITGQKVKNQIFNHKSTQITLNNENVAKYLNDKGKINKTEIAKALGTNRTQLNILLKRDGTMVH